MNSIESKYINTFGNLPTGTQFFYQFHGDCLELNWNYWIFSYSGAYISSLGAHVGRKNTEKSALPGRFSNIFGMRKLLKKKSKITST